ncbi:hypothetical protein [Clostridiisalibacter paucivorans]|uniref:hypothetical protein n=1 Tax=Clostridiisalibacter paucivorans TaxID=408753 RepID=UPI00047AE87E|nr:hypothetical protein [Clostridiisalibacter paucivorans]
MYDELPKKESSTHKSNFFLFIPFVLMFSKGKDDIFNKVSSLFEYDFQQRVNMVKDIKPYFSEKEQLALSKVQDVMNILNMINRIKSEDYSGEIKSVDITKSREDRKKEILDKLMKYLDDENKTMVQKVIKTRDNLESSKEKLYKNGVMTQSINTVGFNNLLDLIKCFEPLIQDEKYKKVRKFEKVMEIMKTPDEKF